MTRLPALSFLFACSCTTVLAQGKTADFQLAAPEQKISNSLYSTIGYLDSRKDTTNLGIVQLGAFNIKAKVVPRIPFRQQLTAMLDSLTDRTAGKGSLLLQVEHFSFGEVTGAFSERGYFNLRANLYSDSGGLYQTVARIDTLMVVKAGDVTKPMLRNASKLIIEFIASNLDKRASDPAYYSMNDVMNIDSIDKQKLKLYTTTTYADGIYLTYRAFRDQVPDKPIRAKLKDGQISSVRTTDSSGAWVKVKSKNLYALVYEGKPFAATTYGFYELGKRDNDFYFTGEVKVTADATDVIVAGMIFGLLGSLLASNADATFEMQIDHVSGGFIRIREIKMPPDQN